MMCPFRSILRHQPFRGEHSAQCAGINRGVAGKRCAGIETALCKFLTQNNAAGRDFHRVKDMLAEYPLDVTEILRRTRPGQPLIKAPVNRLRAGSTAVVSESLLNLGQRLPNAYFSLRRVAKSNSAGTIPAILGEFVQVWCCPVCLEDTEHLAGTNALLEPLAIKPGRSCHAIEPCQNIVLQRRNRARVPFGHQVFKSAADLGHDDGKFMKPIPGRAGLLATGASRKE